MRADPSLSRLSRLRRTAPAGWRGRAAGFTLIEILIALALVTTMTIALYSALAPWIAAKQKQDTEHRLALVTDAVQAAYRDYAMQVDSLGSTVAELAIDHSNAITLASSTITATGGANGQSFCAENANAATLLAPYLADSPVRGLRDGQQHNFCFFVSVPQSKTVEGVKLWYRVVAVVSTGSDGKFDSDPLTIFDPQTGTLTLAANGDDIGTVVSGYPIQYALYQETKARMNRVADLYAAYFTARFQGNPARDYSIDYFSTCAAPVSGSCASVFYDTAGSGETLAQPTGGAWLDVKTALAPALGIGPQEWVSAWDNTTLNTIQVANQQLTDTSDGSGISVQVLDSSKSVNLPPYTALLRTQLPSPSDQSAVYSIKVVPGTY